MTMKASAEVSNWGDLEVLGKHHISTLPRYWMTRIYVAGSTLTGTIVTWQESGALTHKLIEESGPIGWYLVALLALFSVAAILDVIVNDILPDSMRLNCTKKYRHVIYAALAMGNVCLCYVFVAGQGWWRPLMLPFCLDASFAALVAVLDLFQRHRTKQ